MNYIFIGMLAGSLVTSDHSNKEACEGRAVTLREKGVVGKCIEQNNSTGLFQISPSYYCQGTTCGAITVPVR